MPFALSSRRGAALNWRLAVKGIQNDERSSMTGREFMAGSPRKERVTVVLDKIARHRQLRHCAANCAGKMLKTVLARRRYCGRAILGSMIELKLERDRAQAPTLVEQLVRAFSARHRGADAARGRAAAVGAASRAGAATEHLHRDRGVRPARVDGPRRRAARFGVSRGGARAGASACARSSGSRRASPRRGCCPTYSPIIRCRSRPAAAGCRTNGSTRAVCSTRCAR